MHVLATGVFGVLAMHSYKYMHAHIYSRRYCAHLCTRKTAHMCLMWMQIRTVGGCLIEYLAPPAPGRNCPAPIINVFSCIARLWHRRAARYPPARLENPYIHYYTVSGCTPTFRLSSRQYSALIVNMYFMCSCVRVCMCVCGGLSDSACGK